MATKISEDPKRSYIGSPVDRERDTHLCICAYVCIDIYKARGQAYVSRQAPRSSPKIVASPLSERILAVNSPHIDPNHGFRV